MKIFLGNTTQYLPGSQTPSAHISESFHPECQRECPGCPVETVVGTGEKGKCIYRETAATVSFYHLNLPRLAQ